MILSSPLLISSSLSLLHRYGIIRDVIQNHLLQAMALLAMEPPVKLEGPLSGDAIFNAKRNVLQAIEPVKLENVVLGQYEGYTEDESITNKDSNTETFATICLYINNPRWAGVPFIFKAGKYMNEKKSEMRIQFKDAPAAHFMFNGQDCPRNELGKCAVCVYCCSV
jgi:glucose-6-phosphate 1-dehydrogenase